MLIFTLASLYSLGAFLGLFKLFLWAGDQVEKRLSHQWKSKWNNRLNDWWLDILTTQWPNLASKEAKKVIIIITNFLQKFRNPYTASLSISIFLTTSAFFFGNMISLLNEVARTTLIDFIFQANIIWLWFYIHYSKKKRIIDVRYWILLTLFIRLGYYTIMEEHNIIISENQNDLFINILTDSLLLVYAFIIAQRRFFRLTLSGDYTQREFFKSLAIIILAYMFADGIGWSGENSERSFGWRGKEVGLGFQEIFVYIINFIFDTLTVFFTINILKRMSENRSFQNLMLILLDLMIALCLAYLVLASLIIVGSITVTGTTVSFENVKEVLSYSFEHMRLGTIFYALTTFIPSIVFMSVLLVKYIGKLAYLIIGRLSKVIFYKEEERLQKSPVYMAIALIAFILSIPPAIYTFQQYMSV